MSTATTRDRVPNQSGGKQPNRAHHAHGVIYRYTKQANKHDNYSANTHFGHTNTHVHPLAHEHRQISKFRNELVARKQGHTLIKHRAGNVETHELHRKHAQKAFRHTCPLSGDTIPRGPRPTSKFQNYLEITKQAYKLF
jgi:hypothetical protein